MTRFLVTVGLSLAVSGSLFAGPPVVKSVQSGNWSSGSTWDGGKTPAAGDKVLVRTGHSIIYDAKAEAVIRSVHISGVLSFAPDKDTLLNAGLIKIQTGDTTDEDGFDRNGHFAKPENGQAVPTLLVGTSERPINAMNMAILRLHYIEGMDRDSCPAIVCCGGRMDFHGQTMNRTWVEAVATGYEGRHHTDVGRGCNRMETGRCGGPDRNRRRIRPLANQL